MLERNLFSRQKAIFERVVKTKKKEIKFALIYKSAQWAVTSSNTMNAIAENILVIRGQHKWADYLIREILR